MAHWVHTLTCLLAIWVGTKTLAIWTRTRQVPELAIGLSVFSIAVGGAIFAILGATWIAVGHAPPRTAVVIGVLALLVHVVATFGGSWKIFRPRSRGACLLFVVGSGLGLAWAWRALAAEEVDAMLLGVARGTGMVWLAFEAFRYAFMLRRRIAIGLADPLIAHRFLLWGIGASAQATVVVLDLASHVRFGAGLDQSALGIHVMATLGLVGTVAVALAFFPPARYRRAIESEAKLRFSM